MVSLEGFGFGLTLSASLEHSCNCLINIFGIHFSFHIIHVLFIDFRCKCTLFFSLFKLQLRLASIRPSHSLGHIEQFFKLRCKAVAICGYIRFPHIIVESWLKRTLSQTIDLVLLSLPL